MTPKEKAKELVMWMAMHQVWHEGDTSTDGQKQRAKNCALISVNETINHLDFLCGTTWRDLQDRTRSFPYETKLRTKSQIEYWQEVKKEIELL